MVTIVNSTCNMITFYIPTRLPLRTLLAHGLQNWL